MTSNFSKLAESVFAGMDKSNSELLALIYGSLVTQILKDTEDIDCANTELHRLGVEAGSRLIEDFISRTQLTGCTTFWETCEVIAKVAFRVFLGVAGEVLREEEQGSVVYVSLPIRPLSEFVDIPSSLAGLQYYGYVCGVIEGALHQVQLKVKVSLANDSTNSGGETAEMRLELLELLKESFVDLEEC